MTGGRTSSINSFFSELTEVSIFGVAHLRGSESVFDDIWKGVFGCCAGVGRGKSDLTGRTGEVV